MKLFGKEYNERTKHKIYYIAGIKITRKDKCAIYKDESDYLRSIINAIGTDKIPPAKGELRQWQLECLDLLKTFDKICRENGLQYWLDFGTLLGALRHKGFIPWDDDIDTSMLYSDLEKLLPILGERLKNSDFYLRENHKNNFQIRIRHKKYNLGMDIFPVYEYPKNTLNTEEKENLIAEITQTRKLFEQKYCKKFNEKTDINKIRDCIAKLQDTFIPKDELPSNPVLVRGIDYSYAQNEFIIPNDYIFPLCEIEFEGCKFLSPNKSAEYMTSLWGEWMDMPKGVTGIYEHFYNDYKNKKDIKDKE